MIWFFSAVAIFVVLVLLAWRFTSIEFVSHARQLFKAWSVWLAGLGSIMSAYLQSFPSVMVDAWNALPSDVKSIIPQNYLGLIAAFMVAMGVVAQFVRQKKITEEANRDRTNS